MIAALLLMIAPGVGWERISRAQRGVAFIVIFYLLPLLSLSSVGEAYRLVHWGMIQREVPHRRAFSLGETVVSEAAHFVLSRVVVFVVDELLEAAGETFHARQRYT